MRRLKLGERECNPEKYGHDRGRTPTIGMDYTPELAMPTQVVMGLREEWRRSVGEPFKGMVFVPIKGDRVEVPGTTGWVATVTRGIQAEIGQTEVRRLMRNAVEGGRWRRGRLIVKDEEK